MNGDPDTAADITQDVFLKLLENIQSVRKIGKFQNYLLTIAVNTCNNYTKKAKPLYMDLETLEDIEDTDNAFEKIELNELKAQIQYAINTLPDYQNWNDIWLILEEAIMYDPKTKWCIRMVAEL